MRVIKWALAGAPTFAIYKYTIGKRRAGGQEVLVSSHVDPEGSQQVGRNQRKASA